MLFVPGHLPARQGAAQRIGQAGEIAVGAPGIGQIERGQHPKPYREPCVIDQSYLHRQEALGTFFDSYGLRHHVLEIRQIVVEVGLRQ